MLEAIVRAAATPDCARPANALPPKLAAPIPNLPKLAAPASIQLGGPSAAAEDAAPRPEVMGTWGGLRRGWIVHLLRGILGGLLLFQVIFQSIVENLVIHRQNCHSVWMRELYCISRKITNNFVKILSMSLLLLLPFT